MATTNQNTQQDEHEPGCLDYAVIIALVIPTVIVMLVLGKYDPGTFEKLKQRFGGEDGETK